MAATSNSSEATAAKTPPVIDPAGPGVPHAPGAPAKRRIGVKPEDVLLARVVVQRGLAPRSRVEACIAEMVRLRREGGQVGLGRIMVARSVLGAELCGQLLGAIRDKIDEAKKNGELLPGLPAGEDELSAADSSTATAPGAGTPAPSPAPPAPRPGFVPADPTKKVDQAAPTDPGDSHTLRRPPPPTTEAPESPVMKTLSSTEARMVAFQDEKTGVIPEEELDDAFAPLAASAESDDGAAALARGYEVVTSTEAAGQVVESVEAETAAGGAAAGEPEPDEPNPAVEETVEGSVSKTQDEILDFTEEPSSEEDAIVRTGLLRAFDLKTVEHFEFGPYRLLDEIAQGAMGVIYRARETSTGECYALKVMHNADTSDKELKRFIAEAMMAQKLDHPGIVGIHDFGVVEDVPYLTMELLEGTPLSAVMISCELERDELMRLLAETCEAADYAHRNGVIHRDLKPANVIVCKDRVVITDFGLAKDKGGDFHLTQDGAKVGTPFFLSPEQVHGDKDVDGRADVWALGVILYQMLTDRLPHTGSSLYKLYRHIDNTPPTPPREIYPEVPEALEKICLKALAKKRAHRYQTAGDLARDLRRYLAGEPLVIDLPPDEADADEDGSDDGAGAAGSDAAEAKKKKKAAPAGKKKAAAGGARWKRDLAIVLVTLVLVGGAVGAAYYLNLLNL